MHSDVRTTQRVQNVVRKRLAAGISLGADMGGIKGVCGDRADWCDGLGKPHTAATDCTNPDFL